MFYPEIPLKNSIFWRKKGTFLPNITMGSVRLPDADFLWIIPWALAFDLLLLVWCIELCRPGVQFFII